MTGEIHNAGYGSTIGAILGIVLIAVARLISGPVAINLPASWPGAVLVLSIAGIGAALIISHVRLGHRASRMNRINEGKRNAF